MYVFSDSPVAVCASTHTRVKSGSFVLHAGMPGSELILRDNPGKTGMVGRYDIQLLPPCKLLQSDEDWELDDSSLGGTLVYKVLQSSIVDDKNKVLCDGIYDHFL